MAIIEIDNGSGFCFGVVTAIQKAEEEINIHGGGREDAIGYQISSLPPGIGNR